MEYGPSIDGLPIRNGDFQFARLVITSGYLYSISPEYHQQPKDDIKYHITTYYKPKMIKIYHHQIPKIEAIMNYHDSHNIIAMIFPSVVAPMIFPFSHDLPMTSINVKDMISSTNRRTSATHSKVEM